MLEKALPYMRHIFIAGNAPCYAIFFLSLG